MFMPSFIIPTQYPSLTVIALDSSLVISMLVCSNWSICGLITKLDNIHLPKHAL